MFIKITKSGPRQYIQLVEAYRDDDGTTRHRHVANLGRLDEAKGKLGLSRAAGRAPPEVPTFERALEAGGPWVLWSLWNRLGLSRCLRGFDLLSGATAASRDAAEAHRLQSGRSTAQAQSCPASSPGKATGRTRGVVASR